MGPIEAELIKLLPRLRRFARALARDRADADDLVQQTLERALARTAQYRPDFSLQAWVYGIMRHAWIDETRAGRRRAGLMAPEDHGLAVVDNLAERPLEAIAMRRALHNLPADQRLAVALVLVEGLSYREAAEVADVPEGTLTSRLARGRAALAAELSPEFSR